MIKNLFLAGAGGFIGSSLRYLCYQILKNNQPFVTTFLINVIGSFIIGIVISWSIKDIQFNNNWKVFLAAGCCGGFTTFSAFSMENLLLIQEGKYFLSLSYTLTSVIAGIVACFIGYKLSV